MKTKVQLRREIDEKRLILDPAWISTASGLITDKLRTLDEFREASSVALYKAIDGEVDLEDLFLICWNAGKRTCIPVFNDQDKVYELAEITPQTCYSIGHYGIPEPMDAHPASCSDIDLMFVPGVAFDSCGRRLGRGGGYYDRLLDGFGGYSVAVAFDFQIYPRIPSEPHDMPVHAVVTETKVMKVQNEH